MRVRESVLGCRGGMTRFGRICRGAREVQQGLTGCKGGTVRVRRVCESMGV